MKKFCWVYLLVILFCRQIAVGAEGYAIYVFNRPFSGNVISRDGKIYVAAQEMAVALGLRVQEKEDLLTIGEPPQTKVEGKVILNGKPFADTFQDKTHAWYVALKPFVEAIGCKFVLNVDTKIIDILPGNSSLTQKAVTGLENKTDAAKASGRFYSREDGFSIQFPASWEQEQGFMGTVILGVNPQGGNVNVVVSELSTPMSLQDYYHEATRGMDQILTDYKQLESGDGMVDNQPVKWLVYRNRMGRNIFEALQYFLVKDQRGYVITCTIVPERFDESRGLFETVAHSFKFE